MSGDGSRVGGLPSRLRCRRGRPRRRPDPRPKAELFLGFTSTLAPRPRSVADREPRDARPRPHPAGGYFTHGTHMHLSHIHENLEALVVNSYLRDGVQTTFRPGRTSPSGRVRAAGPCPGVDRRRRAPKLPGARTRSATAVRCRPPPGSHGETVGADGTVYPAGVAIPQRADFNTLDNPFAWSADGTGLGRILPSGRPLRRLHPTSDDFHRVRRAMDGALPDGTTLALRASRPRARGSTASSARRGARTSSCRRAPTAPFPLSEIQPLVTFATQAATNPTGPKWRNW